MIRYLILITCLLLCPIISLAADGEDDAATPQVVADTFLPPNSLYQVSMPNIRGEMIGFDRFRGFVTLVVNVACL